MDDGWIIVKVFYAVPSPPNSKKSLVTSNVELGAGGDSIENLDNNPSIVHAPSLFIPQTENAATSNKPIRCGAAEKQPHMSNKLRVAASSMALLPMTPKQPWAATPTHPVHNLSSASNGWFPY